MIANGDDILKVIDSMIEDSKRRHLSFLKKYRVIFIITLVVILLALIFNLFIWTFLLKTKYALVIAAFWGFWFGFLGWGTVQRIKHISSEIRRLTQNSHETL